MTYLAKSISDPTLCLMGPSCVAQRKTASFSYVYTTDAEQSEKGKGWLDLVHFGHLTVGHFLRK